MRRLFRETIGHNLEFALRPYRRSVCRLKERGDEFMRFLLTVIRGREIDAVDRAIMLKLRGICKILCRKADTDLRIREDSADN